MKPNLLLVTEHYPCGNQETFLETEINYFKEIFHVHVITTDTDRLMTRALPKDVVFSRPAGRVSPLRASLTRFFCLFSQGYRRQKAIAKEKGIFTREYRRKLLDTLEKSRRLYDYVSGLELLDQSAPLLIYSANFNDYLYGLCCLKDFGENVKVVARCHEANMFDPVTRDRRDTMNGVIDEMIDGIFFTSESRREEYAKTFCGGQLSEKFYVSPLGVPQGKDRPQSTLPDFSLRIVTECPMEDDKRLKIIIDALSLVTGGFVEWVHIGTGSKRKEIMDYAEDILGEKQGVRVKFFGKMSREEVAAYYGENYVDFFLSVSASESVPTAMMEAMASHIFVVATEVDGVSDVVNNENGMLLPPNLTAIQLAKAIGIFCRMSKSLIRKKGEAAFSAWEERFDSRKNCSDFVCALSRMAGLTDEEMEKAREESRQAETQKLNSNPFAGLFASSARHDTAPKSFKASLIEEGLIAGEQAETGEKETADTQAPEPETGAPAADGDKVPGEDQVPGGDQALGEEKAPGEALTPEEEGAPLAGESPDGEAPAGEETPQKEEKPVEMDDVQRLAAENIALLEELERN